MLIRCGCALEVDAASMTGAVVRTGPRRAVVALPAAATNAFACLARPVVVAFVRAAAHGAVSTPPAGVAVAAGIVAEAVAGAVARANTCGKRRSRVTRPHPWRGAGGGACGSYIAYGGSSRSR